VHSAQPSFLSFSASSPPESGAFCIAFPAPEIYDDAPYPAQPAINPKEKTNGKE
jgi:hypothetical protein